MKSISFATTILHYWVWLPTIHGTSLLKKVSIGAVRSHKYILCNKIYKMEHRHSCTMNGRTTLAFPRVVSCSKLHILKYQRHFKSVVEILSKAIILHMPQLVWLHIDCAVKNRAPTSQTISNIDADNNIFFLKVHLPPSLFSFCSRCVSTVACFQDRVVVSVHGTTGYVTCMCAGTLCCWF